MKLKIADNLSLPLEAVTQDTPASGYARFPMINNTSNFPALRHASATGHSTLGAAERKILTVLAQRPQGCDLDLDRLAILSGYTVNGHFKNTLGRLRSRNLMSPARVIPIQITQAGLRELGDFEPLPTGKDLQQWWLGKLGGAERRTKGLMSPARTPIRASEDFFE